MRVLIAPGAGEIVVAITSLETALANPVWDGLSLFKSDTEVFAGYPLPADAQPVERLTPGASKVDLIAYAHDAHLAKEAAGTIWSGWPVAVNERAMTRAVGEVAAILIGARKDTDPWTFADGVARPVPNDGLKELSLRMRRHVGVCLAVYNGVVAGIEAEQVTTTAQVDGAFAGVDAIVQAVA